MQLAEMSHGAHPFSQFKSQRDQNARCTMRVMDVIEDLTDVLQEMGLHFISFVFRENNEA